MMADNPSEPYYRANTNLLRPQCPTLYDQLDDVTATPKVRGVALSAILILSLHLIRARVASTDHEPNRKDRVVLMYGHAFPDRFIVMLPTMLFKRYSLAYPTTLFGWLNSCVVRRVLFSCRLLAVSRELTKGFPQKHCILRAPRR